MKGPYDNYRDNNRVAVIGASPKEETYSNKAIKAFKNAGWNVIPVGRWEGSIEGEIIVSDVSEAKNIDMIAMYISAEAQRRNASLVDSICKSGAKLVIFNPGTENKTLEEKLKTMSIEAKEECCYGRLNEERSYGCPISGDNSI